MTDLAAGVFKVFFPVAKPMLPEIKAFSKEKQAWPLFTFSNAALPHCPKVKIDPLRVWKTVVVSNVATQCMNCVLLQLQRKDIAHAAVKLTFATPQNRD